MIIVRREEQKMLLLQLSGIGSSHGRRRVSKTDLICETFGCDFTLQAYRFDKALRPVVKFYQFTS